MQEYIDFFMRHSVLSGILVTLLFAWLLFELKTKSLIKKLAAQDLVKSINHDNAVVIDIRDNQNFSVGHIAGSINLPLKNTNDILTNLKKYAKRPIVFVIDMGQDSNKLYKELLATGKVDMSELDGGITAWKKAGLPVVSS